MNSKLAVVRAGIAVAMVVSMSPVAFAAKNNSARVNARSRTNVTAVQTSFSVNNTNVDQDNDGNQSNQKAKTTNSANSGVFSSINASSGNVVDIDQD